MNSVLEDTQTSEVRLSSKIERLSGLLVSPVRPGEHEVADLWRETERLALKMTHTDAKEYVTCRVVQSIRTRGEAGRRFFDDPTKANLRATYGLD